MKRQPSPLLAASSSSVPAKRVKREPPAEPVAQATDWLGSQAPKPEPTPAAPGALAHLPQHAGTGLGWLAALRHDEQAPAHLRIAQLATALHALPNQPQALQALFGALREVLSRESRLPEAVAWLRLLTRLALHPCVDSRALLADLASALRLARSRLAPAGPEGASARRQLVGRPGFLAQLLASLRQVLCSQRGLSAFLSHLPQTAARGSFVPASLLEVRELLACLRHPAPPVRAAALRLLSSLCPQLPVSRGGKGGQQVQLMLVAFLRDAHPLVRREVMRALLRLQARGVPLDPALYSKVTSSVHHHQAGDALPESDAQVREQGLEVLFRLSRAYPWQPVQLGQGQVLSLLDDTFTKLCLKCTDVTRQVRQTACRLLGICHGVNQNRMLQTFSKKPLRELNPAYAGPRVDLGKNYHWWVPEGDLDIQETPADFGWTGAIVHGCEDEYFEVRNAAICSICELGLQSATFAKRAVEALADMFNDDIESVRQNALRSLSRLGSVVRLSDDYLSNVLVLQDDALPSVRSAVHRLLQSICLKDLGQLLVVVASLHRSLVRHPEDTHSIYRCMRALGSHHAELCELLVAELLHYTPMFLQAEPQLSDQSYVASAVLLYNALQRLPALAPHLPPYAPKHFAYLRVELPEFFPTGAASPPLPAVAAAPPPPCIALRAKSLQPHIRHRFALLRSLRSLVLWETGLLPGPVGWDRAGSANSAAELLAQVQHDLTRLQSCAGGEGALLRLHLQLLQLLRTLSQLVGHMQQALSLAGQYECELASQKASRALVRLLCCYMGLGVGMRYQLLQVALSLRVLSLECSRQRAPAAKLSLAGFFAALRLHCSKQHLAWPRRLETVEALCGARQLLASPGQAATVAKREEEARAGAGAAGRRLATELCLLLLPEQLAHSVENVVKQCEATIRLPSGLEKPISVRLDVPGPVAVTVRVSLQHVVDPAFLCLTVAWNATEAPRVFFPPLSHFMLEGPLRYLLHTQLTFPLAQLAQWFQAVGDNLLIQIRVAKMYHLGEDLPLPAGYPPAWPFHSSTPLRHEATLIDQPRHTSKTAALPSRSFSSSGLVPCSSLLGSSSEVSCQRGVAGDRLLPVGQRTRQWPSITFRSPPPGPAAPPTSFLRHSSLSLLQLVFETPFSVTNLRMTYLPGSEFLLITSEDCHRIQAYTEKYERSDHGDNYVYGLVTLTELKP
eukprot:g24319.t1